MAWQSPTITVKWGPYFAPDPDEENKIVTMVQSALGGGMTGGTPVVTLRAAVEKVAPIFGIENVEATLEQLEQEQAERDDRELQKTTAEQEALHALGGGAPGAGRGKPPKAGQGGSGGAPAAAP